MNVLDALADPENGVIGAAHAGWRGLAAGVVERTVHALCGAAGCEPGELVAWLGDESFLAGSAPVVLDRTLAPAPPESSRS